MRALWILLALLVFLPGPAQASWAVALVPGGDPIFTGHHDMNIDEGPKAVSKCNEQFHTTKCHVVARVDHGCLAFANDGGKGTAIKWGVGGDVRQSVAYATAMQSCQAQSSGACKVVQHFCMR